MARLTPRYLGNSISSMGTEWVRSCPSSEIRFGLSQLLELELFIGLFVATEMMILIYLNVPCLSASSMCTRDFQNKSLYLVHITLCSDIRSYSALFKHCSLTSMASGLDNIWVWINCDYCKCMLMMSHQIVIWKEYIVSCQSSRQ